MATQPDDLADEIEHDDLDLDLGDDTDADADPQDDDGGDNPAPANDADDGEDVVSFGGAEANAEPESEGVRNLREELKREKARRRELEAKVAPKVDEVGDKPSIDDYWENPDDYDRELLAWNERRRQADERAGQQEQANRAAQERWQEQQRDFEGAWGGLRNSAKDAARAKVEDAFSPEQQAMLVKAARGNGAGLFLRLGVSDADRAELEKLKHDPVEFVATAAVMAKETQVTRKPKTLPETVHRGSGGSAGKTDARMERLTAEAAKSGDYSKVVAARAAARAK